jgi:hexosaminidase
MSPNTGYIVWQEVFDNGQVKPDTIVQVWGGNFGDELSRVTKQGYRALLSSCWYLDNVHWNPDWPDYYACDPQNFNGNIIYFIFVNL